MPFTGSHPAAVLPLLGLPLPASGLIIGSVVPDLPYYLPGTPNWQTHTALAVPTLDLLLGGLCWLLWHGLVAAPALASSPRRLRARLSSQVTVGLSSRIRRLRDVTAAVVALMIGAATHVGWDEFSHPNRFGTRHLAALHDDWNGLPGYRWVQYASGALGAAAITLWLFRWWRRTPPAQAPSGESPEVWLLLLAVASISGLIAALRADGLRAAAFAGATRGGGAALIVGLACALSWQFREFRQRHRSGWSQ